MKRALVLAGGGSKGSYELGFIKALYEHGIHFDIVTGTSIGALNACMIVQKNTIEEMEDLWDHLDFDHVFASMPDIKGMSEDFMTQKAIAVNFFKGYLENRGADVRPFYEIVRELLDEKALLDSNIDFGLCTVKYPSLKPVYMTKNEMPYENIYKYLLASAACFPAFPMIEIDGEKYLDGGYYDNLPIDLAIRMGADEIIAVDLHGPDKDIIHACYLNRPHIIYSRPYSDLGTFMNFAPETIARNKRLGYLTGLKTIGVLEGKKYSFQPYQNEIYETFYRHILLVESSKRTLFNNDDAPLTDVLLTSHNHVPLALKDYTYLTMDYLGDLIEADEEVIYNFQTFLQEALDHFASYRNQDYMSGTFKDDVKTFIKDMNKERLVGSMYHMFLYPENETIDMLNFVNVFPKELLVAMLLYDYDKIMNT